MTQLIPGLVIIAIEPKREPLSHSPVLTDRHDALRKMQADNELCGLKSITE